LGESEEESEALCLFSSASGGREEKQQRSRQTDRK
jgi:hypothetical protein